MFSYKKNILISLLFLFLLLLSTAIIMFIIDPLQHYRKATWYKPYPLEQRYLLWGLIDNYTFDSLLIGTSMSENFVKSEIDTTLNFNTLLAPIAGATAYEENLLIDRAIKRNVKNIIYPLDLFGFKDSIHALGSSDFPSYLENNTYWDDYKYLLNSDIIFRDTSKLFLANFMGIKSNKLKMDTFWTWKKTEEFSAKACKNAYTKLIQTNNAFYAENFHLNKSIQSFNINIFPHLNNRKINYYIIFPPYSILTYKLFLKHKKLKEFLAFKKYIVNKLNKHPNIKIYDFQVATNITHNLDNYKDIGHYSKKINSWMIQQIKQNKYRINKDNVNKYLKKLNIATKNYVIDDI